MIDAVVLAGGASRRMGRDKARLPVDGAPLVDHVVAALAPLDGTVRVASGTGQRLGRPDEIADPPGCTGPLGGLLAGLAHARTPLVAVVAVDMPAVDARVLLRLADLCRRTGRSAALPIVAGVPQPLHSVVARTALPALWSRVHRGARSPRRALGALDALLVGPDGWSDVDPAATFVRDWDRPEDLPATVRAVLGGP